MSLTVRIFLQVFKYYELLQLQRFRVAFSIAFNYQMQLLVLRKQQRLWHKLVLNLV